MPRGPTPAATRRFASLAPAQRRQPAFRTAQGPHTSCLLGASLRSRLLSGDSPLSERLRGPTLDARSALRFARAWSAATACFQDGSGPTLDARSALRFARAWSAATAAFRTAQGPHARLPTRRFATLAPAQQRQPTFRTARGPHTSCLLGASLRSRLLSGGSRLHECASTSAWLNVRRR